ncbi:MAG: mandelate racemase/muconate lactonizing enzyme family protein, partial [Rhodospirillaceae bacterium]
MKIEAVRTHVLYCDIDNAFQSSFSTFQGRWACLVEIECADGTVGWGECLGPAKANAGVVAAMAPQLIGRNPLDIEPIWAALCNEFRDQGQHGLVFTAQSGIDIALWDIAGKHFGVPVSRLLGGAYRTEVPAYATGGFRVVGKDHHQWVADETVRYVAEGFTPVKIKIGYHAREDVELT